MRWVVALANCVHIAWTYSGIIIFICKQIAIWSPPPVVRWVFHETRPFYLPAVGIETIHTALTEKILGWNVLWISVAIAAWWIYKDLDEDDRWKRRRKKVSEKVSRIGSRLIVVPASN